MITKGHVERINAVLSAMKEPKVVCIYSNGERKTLNWLDANSLAIKEKKDSKTIDHFEDAKDPVLGHCADLPNMLLPADQQTVGE